MCNTAHVDPHGMHRISANSTSSPKQAKFWHRWPFFSVAGESGKEARLTDGVLWRIAAGSDVQLQCEYFVPEDGQDQVLVRSYDGDGNFMAVMGQFRSGNEALAALPSLLTVTHMLYPNHLLMPNDAE